MSELRDPTIEEFYKYCSERKLMAVRCIRCRQVMVPPRAICSNCRNCRNARGSEDSQHYPDVKARRSEDWYAARSRLQPETTGRWMAQLAPLLLQRNRLRIQSSRLK